MLLPNNIDISARSHKFYDGTYTLSADGFTDETGVYRAFDCLDPAARAPTPLPPIFLDDEAEGKDTPDPVKLMNGPAEFTFASDSVDGSPVKVLQDNLFRGYDDRDRLLGRIEGIQLASRQKGMELSRAECYRLCGIAYPEKFESITNTSLKGEITTPKRSVKGKIGTSSSPLSDCPSDLSEWEADQKTKKSTPKATEILPEEVPKAESPPKRTRGVAQKVVRKTPKKSAATAVPTLVTRQEESGAARRRSVRQALIK